ncbi:MAG TPA: arylsulfatase [Urbifossiella sp.]|nr:arylsulfatase [Urbifossiella sp.]
MLLAMGLNSPARAVAPLRPPNVVFILADDLGYGDLGCYGQTRIRTPHLDRLAADGVRFTQCYAGSTVCAPSRCALMTGLHTGHCRVRGNGGGGGPRDNVPLRPEDPCVADILKRAGYATALVGKWGLGEEGSTGVPTRKGFDHFFGYLNQHHAHNYYPDFLWRGTAREPVANPQSGTDNVAARFVHYAPDLFREDALRFLAANKDRPFFLYFATTAPHANNEKTRATGEGNEVPTDAPYTNEPWPRAEKNKAAMITRMDADVGALLAKLRELGLEGNTLVLFSSDNGPHKEGGNDPAFFRSSGPFRGIKRALTDGGIRVPMIARWPGVIRPGTTSDFVWAFWDFLPTACDLAGVPTPPGLDGLSVAPTLTGRGEQRRHEFLYWEFHEGGFQQAVRYRNWKAIRPALGAPLELYGMVSDPGETQDVAAANPDEVARVEAYLRTVRTDSPDFPVRPAKKK